MLQITRQRIRQHRKYIVDNAESMSKEKQSTVVTRKKNPMAISQFTKSRYGGSSVARSTVQLKGIFAAPPNPGVRPRNYEGELVL